MKDFAGKICFITGGASGAGLGQAKVFGKAGMKVAIADIRQDALDSAVEELVAYGIKREDILAIKADLTNRKSTPQLRTRWRKCSAASAPSHPDGGRQLLRTSRSLHLRRL